MKHVMVDLETLGTGNNAVIVSIGAVVFDEDGLLQEFYEVVSPESSVTAGMQIDASTVVWWMQQNPEARKIFIAPSISLGDALDKFTAWYPSNASIWGNGATFDNVILTNAYRLTGKKTPWKYSKSLCYRTLKSLFPEVPVEEYGVAHNALDDAKKQALHAIKLFNLVTKES